MHSILIATIGIVNTRCHVSGFSGVTMRGTGVKGGWLINKKFRSLCKYTRIYT